MKQDMIVILDLGSTENTVIARQIRDLGVYSEIHPHDITPDELKALNNVKGIILNGGENRVVDGETIDVNPAIYDCGYPVMAIDHPTAKCEQQLAELPDEATLKAFIFDKCQAEANWNMKNFIEDQVELVRRQVGDKKVLLALSGGVDSSVVAALLLKAIGQQLVCVHVNHGLMRKNESENVVEVFRNQLNANLIYVDATERFLTKLENVADPEQKRKIIGGEFIRVFEEEARKLEGIDFLGQGTIYPDILESDGVKAHHNVGGLPKDMGFEGLVEPVKYLYKDEVRKVGSANTLVMGKDGKLDEFSEMDLSALQEIGNIIAGSYLSAISAFTNMTISASVPYLSIDMAGAILSVPAIEFSKISDKALLIETEFGDKDTIINGYFILIPTLDAFATIFSALGLS